jgi:hypothetical protein
MQSLSVSHLVVIDRLWQRHQHTGGPRYRQLTYGQCTSSTDGNIGPSVKRCHVIDKGHHFSLIGTHMRPSLLGDIRMCGSALMLNLNASEFIFR